jgi:4,5-dihydroxyphthalate decarboxylase
MTSPEFGATAIRGIFEEEFFQYGVGPNRKTVEAFLSFGYERGVCHSLVAV